MANMKSPAQQNDRLKKKNVRLIGMGGPPKLNRNSVDKTKSKNTSQSCFHCSFSQCNFKSLIPSNFVRHITHVHAVQDPKIHKCQLCGEMFRNKIEVRQHIAINCEKSDKTSQEEKKVIVDFKRNAFKCSYCNYQTSWKHWLAIHIVKNHGIQDPDFHVCKSCGKAYKNLTSFKSHVEKNECNKIGVGNLKRKFKCQFCNYQSKYAANTRNHTMEVHKILDPKIHECNSCKILFRNIKELNSHQDSCGYPANNVSSPIKEVNDKSKTELLDQNFLEECKKHENECDEKSRSESSLKENPNNIPGPSDLFFGNSRFDKPTTKKFKKFPKAKSGEISTESRIIKSSSNNKASKKPVSVLSKNSSDRLNPHKMTGPKNILTSKRRKIFNEKQKSKLCSQQHAKCKPSKETIIDSVDSNATSFCQVDSSKNESLGSGSDNPSFTMKTTELQCADNCMYPCFLCQESFLVKALLDRHLILRHVKKPSCDFKSGGQNDCGTTSGCATGDMNQISYDIQSSQTKKATNSTDSSAVNLNFSFLDYYEPEEHDSPCKLCKMVCVNESALMSHMRRHNI